ncbi:MAG: phage tail tape measure protein [Lachnospiraceae bacterium]|nr:phage tail tape measure protein [Lachnospiraceae bacterium]
MAKKGTIGTKIVLEGVSEYNKSLKDIAAQEKLLQSEMKKTQAQYKDSEKSEEALLKKKEQLAKQLDLATKRYEENRKMATNSAKAQQEYAEKVNELFSQLGKEEQKLKNLEESTTASDKAIKNQKKTVEELRAELARNEKSYDDLGLKVKEYQTKMNHAESGMIALEKSIDGVNKELEESASVTANGAGALGKIGDAAGEASGKVTDMGDMIKANLSSEAIMESAKALANGIKEIASAAIEVGSSFEASMSQVAATMGITAAEIASGSKSYQLLSDAAKACGEATKYSATEAGEALNYLALAGYDAEKAAATLPKVLDLAAAGGMSLATASDLVTDSMAALGMETDALQNYIDEMAKASQKSNTSVQQLGEATLVCAGAVNSAGVDLETMNAALGVLANNGIKGAEGGTHLRNVLLSLAAPTTNAEIALKALGVETADSSGNLRQLDDILIDLNAALADMGTTDKTRYISNIFNKTDIAAVNALLKGTNGEFDALKNEISNCAGAAADMAETMNDNLKGKLTILQSTLEALGISAYEVFDDELKAGVEQATEAVSRLNKSVKEGDLNASLNKMSDALGDFIERGADIAEEILPKVIDGATWCLENFPTIAATVSGIVTASVAMKTVGPIIQGAQAAWMMYKTAAEGAEISQQALNIAMNANPVGLLVAGVAALTTAVITYSALAGDAVKDTQRLTEEQKKLTDSAEKVSDAVRKSMDARKEDVGTIDLQKKQTAALIEELKRYTNAQSLVVKEQDRAKMIVEELNTLVPDLCLYYNEETHYLSQSTEEIEKNTQALWAQAEAAAYQDHMIEIMKERIEVETEMAKMEDEVTAAKERQTEAQMAYHDALDELNRIENTASVEYADQQMKVLALNEARKEEAELCSDICGPYGELENRLAELDSEYEIIDGRISDTQEVMDEAAAAAEEYSDRTISALGLSEEAYEELFESIRDSVKGQISVFDEYEKAQEESKDQILKNMQEQIDGMESWADDITELAERGIDQGLLQTLAEMGPQGQGYIQAFLKMSDEELGKANELFAKSLSFPDEVTAEILQTYEDVGLQAYQSWLTSFQKAAEDADGELEAASKSLADNSVDGAIDELDERQDELDDKGAENFEAYYSGWERAAGIASPSKMMAEIGGYLVEGLVEGIEDNEHLAEDAAEDAAGNILDKFEDGLDAGAFYDFGRDAIDGFIEGMEARENAAVKAAREMAESISGAFKNKMQISSPSKVFEYYGEMTAEGFDEGFKSYLPKIEDTLDSLTPQIDTTSASSTNTYNNSSNVVMNVYGADGQDVEELARAVNDQLSDELNRKEGTWR